MLKYLVAGISLAVAGCGAAAASPLASSDGEAQVILVRGGCGPAFHPNRFGACVPNRAAVVAPVVVGPAVVAPVRLPPPCPRGYYRDPDPARPLCYPRF